MANQNGTLDVIALLAAAWASKTDGDIKHAFETISSFAREAVEQPLAPDVCPQCGGAGRLELATGEDIECLVCKNGQNAGKA